MRHLLIAVATALLGSSAAFAQISPPNSGLGAAPSLGIAGSPPAVGRTGIPMGATQLADPGLSPSVPVPALPGSIVNSVPMAALPMSSTTAPGLSGSMGQASAVPSMPPPNFSATPAAGNVTNYGIGGMQALPESPPVIGHPSH